MIGIGCTTEAESQPRSKWWPLHTVRLPARLNQEEVAVLTGIQKHDVPKLVKNGLLKPLGGGPRNSVKYFATVEVLKKCQDIQWLERATRVITRRSSESATNTNVDRSREKL